MSWKSYFCIAYFFPKPESCHVYASLKDIWNNKKKIGLWLNIPQCVATLTDKYKSDVTIWL